MTVTVYGASKVKRQRRTRSELAEVDAAIYTAVETENPVSLRGVYYRVVSAGAVPKTEAAYNAVGRRLLKLRRDGTIPYSWITDGTRLMRKPASWSDIDQMLDAAALSYRRALWDDQDVEVIVMSEKEAITGVIYPVTSRYDVELCITRGYSSETFTHSIAQTVATAGKPVYIYQLGDHDPSGVDGWRSFQERVGEFAPEAEVTFERLAVTPGQIELYNLPTRPTKTTDSRAAGFTGRSVEVDAIPATVLRSILTEAIEQHIDPVALAFTQSVEASERELLYAIADGAR